MNDDDDYEEDDGRYEVWPGDNVTVSLINDGYETFVSGKIIGVRSEAYLDLSVIMADGDALGYPVVETLEIEISGVGWIDVTGKPISKMEDEETEE